MRSNDGPTVTVVSLSNLAVPPADEEGEGTVQDAIMLDGPVYPIKEDFKELGYTFFRGVHGNKGIDGWVRVVGSGESGAELERGGGAAPLGARMAGGMRSSRLW